jgi:hypothetical protein
MAGTREKGKIPHGEWPNILAKYNNGKTITQIGRDYGCTAPAIRYIIKRSGMLRDRTGEARAAIVEGPSPQQKGALGHAGERPQSDGPAMTRPSWRPASIDDHLLAPELRQRVGANIASFLVAFDHAVLEGSIESVANLREATDRLMRSTARTRLELEQLLDRQEASAVREKSRRKDGPSQRRV